MFNFIIVYNLNCLCSTGFDQQVSVAILRVAEGLDYSAILAEIELTGVNNQAVIPALNVLQRSSSTSKSYHILTAIFCSINPQNKDYHCC